MTKNYTLFKTYFHFHFFSDDFDYEEVIKYLNGGGGGDMAPLEGGDMPPLEENLVNPLDAEALERMPVKRYYIKLFLLKAGSTACTTKFSKVYRSVQKDR